MGQYGDWAKEQSAYLKIDYGSQVEVEWTGKSEQVQTSYQGKVRDAWEFTFKTPFGEKKYTVSRGDVVAQFDNYKEGDKLVIVRNLKGEKPAMTLYKLGEEAPF